LGHKPDMTCPVRAALLTAASVAMLALGGCSNIEFQGKVFDYMGLSGDRQEPDVRMADRPPLVLPPDKKALPPPTDGVAAATARADWPHNPELSQQEVLQAKKDAQAKELSKKEPLHPYIGKPTLFDKWFVKDKTGEAVDEVPEPDPSDKAPEAVATTKPKPLTPHVPEEITPTEEVSTPESYKNPSALY
jgi:hypothetical protein